MSDAATKKREIRPFFMVKDQIRKIIVVNKPVKESLDENEFIVIGFADFLLCFIK